MKNLENISILVELAEEHLGLLLWKINVEIDSFRANVRIKGFWKFIIETYI